MASPRTERSRQCEIFRIQRIPSQWSMQNLNEQLQKLFAGHVFRTHSLCKHATRASKTALVTFTSPIPEVLVPLADNLIRDFELADGNHEIMFDHCLGVTTLYEPLEGQLIKADILFIHGLSGHAVASWASKNGKCWPRDFLGNDLGGARIMSFGYEARLDQNSSTSQLSDFGQQLLEELSILRGTTERQQRPLFFVGHNFGGTIISWVLHELSSRKDDLEYQNTLRSIRCATFFGAPHQGMSVQYLEPLAEKRQQEAMKRTLHDLNSKSEILKLLGNTLRRLHGDVQFITCVEQKLTLAPQIDGQPRRYFQAVSLEQARIWSQNEDIIPIHADHQEMIKFSSEEDRHYSHVLRRLKKALEGCKAAANVRTLDAEQKANLQSLLRSAEAEKRQKAIKAPEELTCDWAFNTPE